ncbi:hypothetical protein [Actinoplanes sp. GCM10030250]|uniref:hypothetical protein n=1 Tax=Actinoplanes sp. GCM10030250 TaxID=3273376 RepID=UPI003613B2C5
MRRPLLLLAAAGAILVPAGPAFAHTGDTNGVSAYRVTVTGVSTPADGLSVRVVEGGARLELSNGTGRAVEILGYSGEPYIEVRPDGTYQNVNSPAAYLNETLGGDTPLPASADPTAAPAWRQVSTETTVRWHDQRTQWREAGPPAQAAAAPDRAHRLSEWAVPLRDQTRTFEIQGTLDYEPPPREWAWWAGAVLLAIAVTLLAHRWPVSVVPVALIAGITTLGYGLTRILDGGSFPAVVVLAGLLTCAAAYRHPPFYLALSGFVLAAFAGFGSADVFTAAVLPNAGPGGMTRATVAVAIGAGAALALTGVLRLRAAEVTVAPAPLPQS